MERLGILALPPANANPSNFLEVKTIIKNTDTVKKHDKVFHANHKKHDSEKYRNHKKHLDNFDAFPKNRR